MDDSVEITVGEVLQFTPGPNGEITPESVEVIEVQTLVVDGAEGLTTESVHEYARRASPEMRNGCLVSTENNGGPMRISCANQGCGGRCRLIVNIYGDGHWSASCMCR